jgi:D-alanyl-D-alanine carboxypeptidase
MTGLPSRALVFLAVAGLFGMAGSAIAQSPGPSLVVDASTGAILSEDNATLAWHPASTTKMMTAYVALRAVRARRIGLETAIPASAKAAAQPRVKVYIRAGQEVTLDTALKIMMVKSANDIAYVIAEGVGGTVENFVAMMNAEARRLGMADTEFRNPNGWHHPEQQTSARDLAILTMTMLREFPDYADYWGIGAVQLGRQVLNNTNGLIGRYAGANGFKTGFVCASGFNVVATATRGGRTLIAVVLGAYSGAERTVRAAQLLDAGFSSWGGSGRSVASLQPSGTSARSICADVRAFGRGAPLADDADSAGPIAAPSRNGGDGTDMFNIGPIAAGAATSVSRGPGGRVTLGPRESFTPLQVAFGRSAGSASAPVAANVAGRAPAQVAGRVEAPPAVTAVRSPEPVVEGPPGLNERPTLRPRTASPTGGIPLTAGAPVAGAAAFAPARQPASLPEGPIRLQGAAGTGAQAAPLRPGAAAGIRAPQRPQSAAVTPAQPARPAAAPSAASRPASSGPAARPAAKPAARPASAAARPAAATTTRPASPRSAGPTPPRRPADE